MTREQLLSRVFVELADTLVAEYDVLDLLHNLADRSVELLGADASGIILSDQRGHLQVVASTTHEARLVELFMLQNSEGPCLDCFQTGKRVVNVSHDDAEARWPNFRREATTQGYESSHAIPLRLREHVIGVMGLFCAEGSTLSDDNVELGQALADIATIGLLQERAVRQKEVLAEQLQTALNSRVLVEQAKGVLSERARIDVAAAFDVMRRYSRRKQVRLSQVALDVIDGSLGVDTLQSEE